jgi:hypothetical protein
MKNRNSTAANASSVIKLSTKNSLPPAHRFGNHFVALAKQPSGILRKSDSFANMATRRGNTEEKKERLN